MHNWKLSPSDLTFLWDECKRCFYLKVRHDFRRPAAPFPRIFSTIDLLMKDIYLEHSTRKISPTLPEGKTIMTGRWVTSAPVMAPNQQDSCSIQGIFDTVVQFEDGSYGVVDFKTSRPKAEHVAFYSRQLQAYAYALEHPAPGKLHLAPVSRLGLLVYDPHSMSESGADGLALLGSATWLDCPLDENRFLGFLAEVMQLLSQPEPPPPGADCSYCTYRLAARTTSF